MDRWLVDALRILWWPIEQFVLTEDSIEGNPTQIPV